MRLFFPFNHPKANNDKDDHLNITRSLNLSRLAPLPHKTYNRHHAAGIRQKIDENE
jgi:hypothetical protein